MRLVSMFLGLAVLLIGQAPAELQFEVASVRPSGPRAPGTPITGGPARGGPGTNDPEHLVYERVLFQRLLMDAYGVQRDQLEGPDWTISDAVSGGGLFDISAKVPAGATKAQVAVMLQNLLRERFKLELHRKTVEVPGYALVAAKSGAKLRESAGSAGESEQGKVGERGQVRLQAAKDGFPELFPGRNMGGLVQGGSVRMRFRDFALNDLVQQFSFALAARMVDRTGLSGKYDFTLEFTLPENAFLVGIIVTLPLAAGQAAPLNKDGPNPGQLDAVPVVSSAMEKQLGLKLEAAKIAVEMLVIDRVERMPAEN